MSAGSNKTIFGIHSIMAYNTQTKVPYGQSLIVGTLGLTPSAEIIELNGGSSSFAWDNEQGVASSEVSLTLKEYPDWLYKVFFGADKVQNVAEATGAASAIVNAQGTTAQGAAGVDSINISDTSLLRTGKYTIVAVSPTTVDVYCSTNIDFGTDAAFVDEALKVNTLPLTILATGFTGLDGFGIELVGGAGAIAMNVGDTAYFDVRSANTGSESVTIGASGVTSPEFGLVVYAQKRKTGEIYFLDLFKCKAFGFPTTLTEKEFSEVEGTIKMSYDCDRNGIYSEERVYAA